MGESIKRTLPEKPVVAGSVRPPHEFPHQTLGMFIFTHPLLEVKTVSLTTVGQQLLIAIGS